MFGLLLMVKNIPFMFVDFDTLPNDARVWVYQANRTLTPQEQIDITTFLSDFLENWTAHQQTLRASVKILNNFFVIIALDEGYQAASGCSIDKQVHHIKQIEEKLGISLLDHAQIACLSENEIKTIHFSKIKAAISENELTPQTLIFNKSISKISDLKTSWLLPAQETWLKNYFQPVSV